MEKNRKDLYNYMVNDAGYQKSYTDFVNSFFSSQNNAKTLYKKLVENEYSQKTPDNVPTWEYWAGQFCCDLPWARSQSFCKEVLRTNMLNQFPECVRNIGKLMKSKSTNAPIIVATTGTYEGIFFYTNRAFVNTKTNKSGTYECGEDGQLNLTYTKEQQVTPQSSNVAKSDTTQNASARAAIQASLNKNKVKYHRCDGVYEFGCYNPNAIAEVQQCINAVVTGYFNQETLDKLRKLGYEKFTDNDIDVICSKASQPINEGLKLTPLITI